jgi:serine/threonine protein kinase
MTVKSPQIGNYKVLGKLGEGGMAIIYKALQPALQRTVVLKKLKDPNREIINRFKQEALLSASFNHENLAAIYDFLYIGKSYYLVMEYIDGEDLRTIIDSMSPISPFAAALIILGIARGLEYTHARNIIHRDIKPSNILVSYEGGVKLIDFGVAKNDISTRLTVTGMIVGTPAYMAPEQANGDALTAQSDIFPLGILLYEVLTGVKPFYGENNTEILAKIVQNKYTPPEQINPEIPRALRRIIKKALHKERSRRYQTVGKMIHDLENFLPWQIRSRKKEVLSRFMQKTKKAKANSTHESIRVQQLIGLKSWPWRTARYLTIAATLFLSGLMFMQFTDHQIGYAQINLPEKGYSISIDKNKSFISKSGVVNVGPIMRGMHRIEIKNMVKGGVNIYMASIMGGDTLFIRPLFSNKELNPQIVIMTEPKDALVMIDDQTVTNVVPDNLDIAPGKHEILVSHPGYEPINTFVHMQSGQNYNLQFILKKQ